jgi:RNA recognition motif-containing protein
MKTNLYVANIDEDVDEKELISIFSSFGKVASCRIIRDKFTQDPMGYGFVQMTDAVQAERALEANGKRVGSKNIRVSYARERNERNG